MVARDPSANTQGPAGAMPPSGHMTTAGPMGGGAASAPFATAIGFELGTWPRLSQSGCARGFSGRPEARVQSAWVARCDASPSRWCLR